MGHPRQPVLQAVEGVAEVVDEVAIGWEAQLHLVPL